MPNRTTFNRTSPTGPVSGGQLVIHLESKIAPVSASEEIKDSIAMPMDCWVDFAMVERPDGGGTNRNATVRTAMAGGELFPSSANTRMISNEGRVVFRGDGGTTPGQLFSSGAYPPNDSVIRHPVRNAVLDFRATDADFATVPDVPLHANARVVVCPREHYYEAEADD